MNKRRFFRYGLLLLCFFAACHVSRRSQDNSISMSTGFDKQGHRGCRGLMPENTIPAMLKALDLGVTTLEMDVVITKDKKLVLSHDPYFSHEISTLSASSGSSFIEAREERSFNIFQMDYAEVKKIDVGLKPHPRFPRQQKLSAYKPLLSDLLDSVALYMLHAKRQPPMFNIETKSMPAGDGIFHPAPAEFVELLMGVIMEKGIGDRVIIQSFDFRTLQYLHEHYPQIQTAMLIEGDDKRRLEEQVKALGFTPTIYSPAYELVTEDLIKACHDQRMKIIPWTVNEKGKITALRQLGVDGIISDYPDLFTE